MPVPSFRGIAHDLSPGFLREGTGERFVYALTIATDASMERRLQGINARIPRNSILRTWQAQADALQAQAEGLGIQRGLTESDAAFAYRLQHILEAYQRAGTIRATLSQLLGFLLGMTPTVRSVSAQWAQNPVVYAWQLQQGLSVPVTATAYPPARLSTKWDSYPAGRDPEVEPEHVVGVTLGTGDWQWDDVSPVDGSYGSWGAWLILYAVAPNDFAHPAQAWGAGSAYAPDPSGDYSKIVGGAYVLAGTYSGTSQVFGALSFYDNLGFSDYSQISNGAYVLAGKYAGNDQAWGVLESQGLGQGIVQITDQWKSARGWIREFIICFNAAEFDPTQGGGGVNPDGTWGDWSFLSNGTSYVEARFTDCVYGGEIK